MRFSQRTCWPRAQNAWTRLKSRLSNGGRGLIDLTDTNPVSCGLSLPFEELMNGLDEGISRYEPHPFGDPQTRAVIGETFYPSLKPDIEHITLTAGTSEAYHLLFRLFCEEGDNVLMPSPGYPLFSYLTGLNDVETRFYHLRRERGWRPDFDEIERLIDERTRMVFVIQPHNPLGRGFFDEDWNVLAQLALRHDLLIVSDEVFLDFSLGNTRLAGAMERLPSEVPCCVLGGVSKSLALPQMKVSWIIWRGPADWLTEALHRFELILDTYLSVCVMPQRGLITWARSKTAVQQRIIERIRSNLSFLKATVKPQTLEMITPYGGWAVTVRLPKGRDDEQTALDLLAFHGVVVQPGYFFDFEDGNYLVLSAITPEQTWREGVMRLDRLE